MNSNSFIFVIEMKLISSLSMVVLFLFQGMNISVDFHEHLEKVSDFISHYQVHKAYDGDSFYQYVVEELFDHPSDGESHHTDSHEDNTPSHSHQQSCHVSVFVAPSNSVAIPSITAEQVKQHTYYNFHFNSRFLESLFQPPRA
jgi:hypothetical protein